ncbi:MAG: FkbM family methyltransferase [Gammaproteobacteria bacterium]|nr:FkbM family methyltransferase [Gammaproteobacteria bacterium]
MNLNYHFCKFLWQQPWFRPRHGRWCYKTICRHGEAPDYPFSTDFFGLEYQGNLQNSIDSSVYYYGAFEKPLLFFMQDCLQAIHQAPSVFCDIGANIGQHSLFMSRVADQVHAFEPFDQVRLKLLRQIELNAIKNLSVHNVGLSDTLQSLPFYAPTGRNQGIGSFDASTTEKGNRNIGNLSLVTGDSYFREHAISDIDLIKIDVEGFEKAVLAGLRETLNVDRPVVVCELTYGKDLSIRSMDEMVTLFPADYQFFTFDIRKADGSKARRKEAKARRTGDYQLVPYHFARQRGQDDIIACPKENLHRLPKRSAST